MASERFPALFLDGQTAAGTPAEFAIEGADLVIFAKSGGRLARWPLKSLRNFDVDTEIGLRIGGPGEEEERLIVTDSAGIRTLVAAAPHLTRVRASVGKEAGRFVLFAGVSAAFLALLYFGLPRAAEAITPLVPLDAEARMGADVRNGIEASWSFCSDAESEAAKVVLFSLTERLLRTRKSPFTPTLDISPLKMANAFALPGGHIVLTKGLIDTAGSPDEVAGVIAHELGHVIERHAMTSTVREVGTSVILSLIVGGGPGSGDMILNTAATLASFSYSRQLEEEADAIGIALLEGAKIDPRAYARFFERLDPLRDGPKGVEDKKVSEGLELPSILSTHPSSPLRAERARRSAVKDTAPALSDADWAIVRKACPAEDEAPKTNEPGPTPAPAK